LLLRPPQVNHSGHNFTVGDINGLKTLIMGLDQVKGLTRRTIERIQRCRPFVPWTTS
jgi:DNA polymerase III alpha subunit